MQPPGGKREARGVKVGEEVEGAKLSKSDQICVKSIFMKTHTFQSNKELHEVN